MKSHFAALRRLLHHYGASIYHSAGGRATRLGPTAYRALRARLKYGIGPVPFSILRLAEVPESQWNGYVLDNEAFKRSLRNQSPKAMLRIAYNKGLFYEHCLSVGLPTIPILCLVGSTPDQLGDRIPQVRDANHFESILASGAPARLFIKPLPGQRKELVLTELAVWSGDTVKKDEEGFLYFVGRRDEMIKTSGYRVSPTEIEEVVYRTGLVAEVVAFGVEHQALGQAIVLVAWPAEGKAADSAALLEACKAQLPAFMLPQHIDWVDQALPRNANGKIDRKALAGERANMFLS